MKILITGATGFVGRAVTESACEAGHDVTALVRNISDTLPEQVSQIAVGDFADLASLLTSPVIASKTKQSSLALKNTQWTAAASGLAVTTDRTEPTSDSQLDSRLRGNDNIRNGNDGVVYGNDENIVISSEAEKSQDASTEPALSRADGAGMTEESHSEGSRGISEDVSIESALSTAEGGVITEECHSERSRGISKDASTKVDMTCGENSEDLVSAMQNVEVVIHTAARAHVMKEKHSDPAEIYRQINVAFTQELAEAAAKAGVKRFVFLSSIKVNGEATFKQPFNEADLADPKDDYAKSKWQAEQDLMDIGQRSGMEIVILRPPMIYGSGVKGNFANLLKLVNKGLPLPFGNVKNKRSLLALDNLVSAMLMAAKHPAAANQTFLVADDESVSTTQLIRNIATAQGKKARLISIPVSLMTFAAKVLGKQSVADRLFGSLQIDTTKIQKQLGWRPVVTMQQQLEKCFRTWMVDSRLRGND